jgi:uncharacterized membrane protein YqjE
MMPDVLFNALDRIAPATRVVLAGLVHRGELAAVETGEARDHLTTSIIVGACVFVFTLLAGMAFTFAIAAAVWHRDDRGLLLGLLTLGYVLVGAGLAWGLVRRIRAWRPLREIRRQLREDGKCLENLLPDDDSAA